MPCAAAGRAASFGRCGTWSVRDLVFFRAAPRGGATGVLLQFEAAPRRIDDPTVKIMQIAAMAVEAATTVSNHGVVSWEP
ncbi:hypothetical protein ADIAG_04005 [Paeniglutamicibacter gangotriensis Lz1y]|uniref:Uncharacterized protein n=1 Tax=Paeniglutamicibacter gangotriensis Lz1y TaxID=1276920 RepID=M7N4J4_9MICC|nr:hypothetical protein ADIAG_04005 [Paeniglutamicibacter gangotriensis Lz1y]